MRQYIGARYTTKIYQNSQDPRSCEWESGVIYEPLTIVSYQNSSYLSRTEVPANAGNPATPTQYWAQTGFYNGQIAQLQRAVSDINDAIGDIQDLTTDVVTDIISAINNVNVHANLGIEYIKGKKVLILGDSVGDEGISDLNPNYVHYLRDMIEAAGGSIENHSIGGYSVSDNLTGAAGSLSQLCAAVTATDFDIIIVEMGVNDWQLGATRQQFNDGISSFIGWKNNNQINADCFWITPLGPALDPTKTPMVYYRSLLMTFAVANDIHIIDMFTQAPMYCGTNSTLRGRWTRYGDGIHPNTSYAPYYAEFVFTALCAGGTNTPNDIIQGFTLSDWPIFNGLYFHGDGDVTLSRDGSPATYTPASTQVLLGTLPEFARPYRTIYFPVYCLPTPFNVAILSDGRVFGLFPSVTEYSDISGVVRFASLTKTFVNK